MGSTLEKQANNIRKKVDTRIEDAELIGETNDLEKQAYNMREKAKMRQESLDENKELLNELKENTHQCQNKASNVNAG